MTSGAKSDSTPESPESSKNASLPIELKAPQPVADIYNGRGKEYKVVGDQLPESRREAPEKPDESSVDIKVELDDFGLPIRKTRPSMKSSSQSTSQVNGKVTESTDDLPLRSRTATEANTLGKSLTRSVSAPVHESTISPGNASPNDIPLAKPALKATPEENPGVPSSEPAASSEKDRIKPEEGPVGTETPDRRSSALSTAPVVSEWSHQRFTTKDDTAEGVREEDFEWQDMPALGTFDVYDDYGRIVARGSKEEEDEEAVYHGLGGAGKGYTRVQIDEDAQSATSLDEETKYLFPEPQSNALGIEDEIRDPLSQLQTTKTLLTEGQRIAYVGVTRLAIFQMVKDLEGVQPTKTTRKHLAAAVDSMTKWGQQMMIRLYGHMEIDAAEQVMIEQLAEHGVQPADLVPPLMQNSRVNNPMAEGPFSAKESCDSTRPTSFSSDSCETPSSASPPPPYEEHQNDELPEVRMPSQLPSSKKLDIDLRWTVLCDLFLVLIADSTYDSRSRRLLERVAETMDISWLQICRFEKRVIDALEMQEERNKENWDEAEHMEKRRKDALKRRYMIMGLATVGGGLVIGLSAGLLAPVIGAGLAAGFTTIGVSGTSAFLGGVGGTALITSGATITGSTIGIRASNRRTGAVKTFEYRPLHNNKRLNLIVTAAGWMTGKVDDVRLPYSTVDPIMGDIYSILWEPEMLQSMGATINILATEV